MKEITWTEFKLKKLSEIKAGECLKITGDGEMVFYAVIHPEQLMLSKIEGLCGQINASRGF